MIAAVVPRKKRSHPGVVRENQSRVQPRFVHQNPKTRIRARHTREIKSRVIKSPGKMTPSSISGNVIFVGLVFVLLLIKLFIRLEILEMSYQIESTRNEIISQDSLYRELKARRAIEANPRTLMKEAERKLGLTRTMPQQIRKMN
jgi:hypothetical protein